MTWLQASFTGLHFIENDVILVAMIALGLHVALIILDNP